MTYVDCLFCGDPVAVIPNGTYCGDCHVYASRDDGRWKVFIPVEMVPHREVVTDDDGCGQGCEYICRCR